MGRAGGLVIRKESADEDDREGECMHCKSRDGEGGRGVSEEEQGDLGVGSGEGLLAGLFCLRLEALGASVFIGRGG